MAIVRLVFGAHNASLISIETKTGAIRAYVGSKDFNANLPDGTLNGQVDTLSQSPGLSMGSSMKPFNYMSTFINTGLAPTAVWGNFPIDFGGGYKPANFTLGDKPSVSVSTTFALDNSLNRPAVQALMTGGVDNYANLLGSMGYNDTEVNDIKTRAGLTATLGAVTVRPIDHAQAYQTLANGGLKKQIYSVERITDREGVQIYQKAPDPGVRVVDEKYPWLIYSILRSYPTVSKCRSLGYDCAGKTGTNDFSQEKGKIGWPTSVVFWGYTPDLVTGVMAYNSNNAALRVYAVGEKLGQFMWNPYMEQVLPKYTKDKFVRPGGLVDKTICTDTGFLAVDPTLCPTGSGTFVDTQLAKQDANHFKLRVSDCNGAIKLASKADELAGVARDQIFVKFQSNTGSDYIQKQIDDYAQKNGYPAVPTDMCTDPRTTNGSIITKITSPAAGTSYNAGDNMSITVDTGASAGTATFYFDSTQINQSTTLPFAYTYVIPIGTASGAHVVKVVITDGAGHTGTDQITVNVAGTVGISVTSPSGSTPRSLTTTLVATVSDPGSLINNVKFYAKKPTDATFSLLGVGTKQANGTYTFKWDTLVLPPGSGYQIYAVAYDGANGVLQQSATVTFTLT